MLSALEFSFFYLTYHLVLVVLGFLFQRRFANVPIPNLQLQLISCASSGGATLAPFRGAGLTVKHLSLDISKNSQALTITIFQGAIANSCRSSFLTRLTVLQIVLVNYSTFSSSFLLLFFESQSLIHTSINAPLLNLTRPHLVKITFS
jgi:hypothetical protein